MFDFIQELIAWTCSDGGTLGISASTVPGLYIETWETICLIHTGNAIILNSVESLSDKEKTEIMQVSRALLLRDI
jgi:hypothetical protein